MASAADRIVWFSEYAYENELYYAHLLKRGDFFAVPGVARNAQSGTIGVLRGNFFKLDKIVEAYAAASRLSALPVIPAFSIKPLEDIATRFSSYISDLDRLMHEQGVDVNFVVFDDQFLPYLSRIQEIAPTYHDQKEILVSMGVVSDTVFTGPYRILFDPTTWCNIDCVYCRTFSPTLNPQAKPHSGKLEYLHFDSIKAFLRDAKAMDVRHVSIVGGAEPTTVPFFEDIIGELEANGLKADMSTNGTLLNKKRVQRIVDSNAFASITVSVSAATQPTYKDVHPKSEAKWPTLLQNLKYFRDYRKEKHAQGPNMIFLFAIHKYNFHEIEEAVTLAAELGFTSMWFQMLHVDAWNSFLVLTKEQTAQLPASLQRARKLADELGVKWDTYIDPQAEHLKENDGTWSNFMYKHGCLVGWYFSYLSFHSEVMFCCGQKEVHNLKHFHLDYKELWNSESYRYMRHNAKYLNNVVNIRCNNGRDLNNDFCQCCDNHNFNAEVLRFLSDTGLQRFVDGSLKRIFMAKSPVKILTISLLNAVEKTESDALVYSGAPLFVEITYLLLEKKINTGIQLFFAVPMLSAGRERIIGGTFVPVDLEGLAVGDTGRAVVKIDRFDLVDDAEVSLKAKVVYKEGELTRYYEKTEKSIALRTLNQPELGGGLLPLSHRWWLSEVDPNADKKRSVAECSRKDNVFLNSFLVHNADGQEVATLRYGEAHTFLVSLEMLAVFDDPVFRLRFLFDEPQERSVFVFGTNNHRHMLRTREPVGAISWKVHFPQLLLPQGYYEVEIAVLDTPRDPEPSFRKRVSFQLEGGPKREVLDFAYEQVSLDDPSEKLGLWFAKASPYAGALRQRARQSRLGRVLASSRFFHRPIA